MENTLAYKNINDSEKFQNAEQLWFWFLYSKSIQNNFIRKTSTVHRPCELLDVETLITKLYLSGQLSSEQLNVMKIFGDKKRAPHQYIYSENKSAALWNSAMETLEDAAHKKGWLTD
ncbi:MAG: hypothetical protein IKN73_03750 [Alphaproteobacteria bacterium]|nr:hypothetical protein [Alphaproteobacteria bacterium]